MRAKKLICGAACWQGFVVQCWQWTVFSSRTISNLDVDVQKDLPKILSSSCNRCAEIKLPTASSLNRLTGQLKKKKGVHDR